MRRRRMFTLCSALSLLLCVAVCVLWVRSYRGCDYAYSEDERAPEHSTASVVASFNGAAWLCHQRYEMPTGQSGGPRTRRGVVWGADEPPPAVLAWAVPPSADEVIDADDPNIEFRHRWPAWSADGDSAAGASLLVLPYWCLCLASAAIPACALVGRWRRRRASGACLRCGYDLTGNVSGTCPECGTAAGVAR